MSKKSLLIIGGTGFFGKSILDFFNNYDFLNINKIIILSRGSASFSIGKRYKKKIKLLKIKKDILKVKKLPFADYVIYLAILDNYKLDHLAAKNYLNLAKKFHMKSKILYVSSGAVYGKQNLNNTGFKEDYLEHNIKIHFKFGYKKNYSFVKLKNERLFKNFAKNGYKVSIARCFSFVGKYLPLNSRYVVGNFIKNILDNKPISVKADYEVIRSYMYSDDLVKWLLKILNSSSQDCPIYNVGSSDAISIDRLAILLGKKYNLTVNLKNKINYKKVDRFLPNIQKAKKRLNLKNKFSSFNAIIKTINLLNKEL